MSKSNPAPRPARAEDVAAIHALARPTFAVFAARVGYEPLPMVTDFAPYVARGDVQVVEDERGLSGFLALEVIEDRLVIDTIGVRPDMQGKGLGSVLLALAERIAKERGYPRLDLYTNAKMIENVSFYARRGYGEIDRHPHPTRPGNVVVWMAKALA